VQDAALKAEKQAVDSRSCEQLENRIYDNFFAVIEAARALKVSDDTVFPGAPL
jgi:hypothetical protein